MFVKLPIALATTVTLMASGLAFAGSNGPAQTAGANVYKEAAPKANAKPEEGSVKPDAAMERKGLYKGAARSADTRPETGSVNPEAETKRPELYKESQQKPHAQPQK